MVCLHRLACVLLFASAASCGGKTLPYDFERSDLPPDQPDASAPDSNNDSPSYVDAPSEAPSDAPVYNDAPWEAAYDAPVYYDAPWEAAYDAPVYDDAPWEAAYDAPVYDDAPWDAPDPLECSSLPPVPASSCGNPGQLCAYATAALNLPTCGFGHTHDRQAWRCVDGAWLEIARCVERANCPDQPPVDGAICSSPGLDCFYSTTGCDASGVVQCDGSVWRRLNTCGVPRHASDCHAWNPVLTEPEPVSETGAFDVQLPAIALAGTQMFVTFLHAGEKRIRGVIAQTATPSQAGAWAGSHDLTNNARSVATIGFSRDHFAMAWVGTSGLTAREIQLADNALPQVVIAPSAMAPSGIALGPSGGWVGWRSKSQIDPSKYSAHVGRIHSNLLIDSSSVKTVADEGAAAPVPVATSQVMRLPGGGFAIAYPVPASGDFWDDSGVAVDFYSEDGALLSQSRSAIGLTARLSAAAMWDGSVVIVYSPYAGYENEYLYGAVLVRKGAPAQPLPSPLALGAQLGAWGPKVIAMDDGYLVAWTRSDPSDPYFPDNLLLAVHELSGAQSAIHSIGAAPSIPYDIAFSEADRSLHVVWSPVYSSSSVTDGVYHQRLVCVPGVVPL